MVFSFYGKNIYLRKMHDSTKILYYSPLREGYKENKEYNV